MPNAIVKKYSQLTGKDIETVEKLWDKAVGIAKGQGRHPKEDAFYSYVVGILKNMLSITEGNEPLTFQEFIMSEQIRKDISGE